MVGQLVRFKYCPRISGGGNCKYTSSLMGVSYTEFYMYLSLLLFLVYRYRPVELRVWQKLVKTQPYNISVTFPEFCRYLVETDSTELNEHFVPSMDICHPCLMQYDFYGNFRNYSTDSEQLIKRFNTDSKFLPR